MCSCSAFFLTDAPATALCGDFESFNCNGNGNGDYNHAPVINPPVNPYAPMASAMLGSPNRSGKVQQVRGYSQWDSTLSLQGKLGCIPRDPENGLRV